MSTFWLVTLTIFGIVLFFGIIRVLMYHPASFFDFILDIMFLDLLVDLISALFESGGDGFDW